MTSIPQNCNIYDVAKKAGVSASTVSRILNNSGYASKESRKKVMAAVKLLNFSINRTAKTLRVGKSNLIGIIIPSISNDFFSSTVLDIQKQLRKSNFNLLICNTEEEKKEEELYIKSLAELNIAGLILTSSDIKPLQLSNLQNVSIVFLDRQKKLNVPQPYSLLQTDNYYGGKLAGEKIKETKCYKNILLAYDSRELPDVLERVNGFKDVFKKYPVNMHELKVPVNLGTSKELIKSIYSESFFDSVFCSCDLIALSALSAVKDIGKKVPDDVQIIGYDGSLWTQGLSPSLSTIKQNTSALGKETANVLLTMIQDPTFSTVKKILPTFLKGETLRLDRN